MTNLKLNLFLFLLFFTFLESSAQVIGRVYDDDCYEDSSQPMSAGQSLLENALSVGNDKISSVNIHSNRHFIRLFEDNNFQGEYRDIYSDMNDLHSISFEDKTSSIKVLASETTLPTGNESIMHSSVLNADGLNDVGAGFNSLYTLKKTVVNNAQEVRMKGLGQIGTGIVLTGCTGSNDDCSDGQAYIFVYDEDKNLLDALSISAGLPSSTQVIGNTFPVAVSQAQAGSGTVSTTIRFYTFSGVPGAPSVPPSIEANGTEITIDDRIATLSYANINGSTYLFGGNENAERIYIWKADFENRVSGFQLITSALNPNNSIIDRASINEDWNEYRSFWLGKLDKDGRVVLFATHSDDTELWELTNIDIPNGIQFTKIHKQDSNGSGFMSGTFPFYSSNPDFPEVFSFSEKFEDDPSVSSNFLKGELSKFEYQLKDCGDIIDCPIPANISISGPVCENSEAWLDIFNQDYFAYNITICNVQPSGICNNEVSTDFQLGTLRQEHRALEALYSRLAKQADPNHNWIFWCDNTFRVTVELIYLGCEDPSIAVEEVYKNCGPIVDLQVPTEVCDFDPVILTANGSEHYTDYRYSVCLVEENGCKNTIATEWETGPFPSGGINILEPYIQIAAANGHQWRFWCDNTYRVRLVLRNECDGWEEDERYFYVDCDPCEGENNEPGNEPTGGNGTTGSTGDGDRGDTRSDGRSSGDGGLDIKLLGNPFQSKANFKITLDAAQTLTLRIINIEGKVVKELMTNQHHSEGSFTETFDLSNLSDGLYFYQVITKTQMKSGKLVKSSSSFSNN